MACGQLSEEKKATKEVQDICDEVKNRAEYKGKASYDQFDAVSFKTQLVSGTHYFIKVHVGNNSYVHLRVFKCLPHIGSHLELHAMKTGLTKEDSLEIFGK
ncbi:cystatin-B-like [Orbicella faveolata]|uniref:cystatin-B-like n=1 Tax=Orbicella faveolata TaxID=48498 RepID=UPI0009E50994|nr:cystatin-B-like [Orbicella faveolata]